MLTSSSDEQNEDQRPHGCCVILSMRGLHLEPRFIWKGSSPVSVLNTPPKVVFHQSESWKNDCGYSGKSKLFFADGW